MKLPVAHPKLIPCRYKMFDSADIERAVSSVKLWTCVPQYLFRISPRLSAFLSFSVIIVSPSSRECFLPTPFQFVGHPTFRLSVGDRNPEINHKQFWTTQSIYLDIFVVLLYLKNISLFNIRSLEAAATEFYCFNISKKLDIFLQYKFCTMYWHSDVRQNHSYDNHECIQIAVLNHKTDK